MASARSPVAVSPVEARRRKRRSERAKFRRAWIITSVLGAALIAVSAIVFAVSASTLQLTTHSRSLHLADETLRVATAARAQLGFANHLAIVEEQFGMDVTESLAVSRAQALIALDGVEKGLVDLAASGGSVTPELRAAQEAFVQLGRSIVDAIDNGRFEEANELVATRIDPTYVAVFDLVEAERDAQLAMVSATDAWAGRLGDVARFLVALLIPLAVIILYREIVRRQQRQAELEVRLDAERAIGKARDDFVANASHEFRTPLTSVYGLAQLIEEDPDATEPIREMAEMISTEAADLQRMVEDLLTTARLEAGALTYQIEQVLTHEETEEIVRPFTRAGSRIATDVKPAVVKVDRLRQRQILRNLISNALKYGGENIRVEGRKAASWFEWIVTDDGDGIPAELEAKLFERFVHQGTTVAVPGGVGLGLSIVRALAEGMSGTVAYERTNGWTRFIVRVPLAVAHPIGVGTAGSSLTPSRAEGSLRIAATSPRPDSQGRG